MRFEEATAEQYQFLSEASLQKVRVIVEELKQQLHEPTQQIMAAILEALADSGATSMRVDQLYRKVPFQYYEELRQMGDGSLSQGAEVAIRKIKQLLTQQGIVNVRVARANEHKNLERTLSERKYVLKERAVSGQQEGLVA